MTMARWTGTVQDAEGNAVAGASIEVRSESSGQLVQVYADRAGSATLGNPFIAIEATVAFHAPGDAYRIRASKDGLVCEWRFQAVGTAAEMDVDQIVSELEAGFSASYETRAQLYADLDHPDGARGAVYGDSNGNFRGVYRKVGASGSGSWTRIGPLPIVETPASQTAQGTVRLAALEQMLRGEGDDVGRAVTTLPVAQVVNDAHLLEAAAPLPVEIEGGVYPVVVNDQGQVLLGIDKSTGNVVGGGLSSGGSQVVASESALMAYRDGDDLHAVGLDDTIVADLSGLDVKGIEGGNGGHVRAIVDKPMLGSTSVVGAGPARPALLVPANARALYVFIGIGQSLMVGATATNSLISTTALLPDDVLMFSGPNADVRMGLPTSGGSDPVLDPATLTSFTPLVARAGQGGGGRGETAMEAFATNLSILARDIGIQFRSLNFTAAQGGTVYSGLAKGSQIYANMLTALTKAKTLAEAQGWQLVVAGSLHKHGEGDANNVNYYNFLMDWQADIDADVKAITGQTLDVMLFMGQPSSFQGTNPQAVQAMVNAHNTSPNHWLTGPDYPFGEFYSDETHFHGPGYFLIGEQMALAYRDLMWGRGHRISQMLSATREGNIVWIDWDVPVPPLVFDTTTISQRDVMGLRYTDSEGEITITTAEITMNGVGQEVGRIRLTLASTPNGAAETIHYAMSPKITEPTVNRARGNIRDSRGETSRYDGRPLHNWAPHHRISVTIA